MASLLVHLDASRCEALLGTHRPAPGRRVPIPRSMLPRQVALLDEASTLFLITVERARAWLVACVESTTRDHELLGVATIHELDVTSLLQRLGCPHVWQVGEWASTPRIVPPGDAQLLRYHLGLPLEVDDDIGSEKPNAPIPVVHGEALAFARTRRSGARRDTFVSDTLEMPAVAASVASPSPAPPEVGHHSEADALRAAVFANPASMEARRRYAAHLQDLAECGELINLQLDRAERGSEITARERELTALVGARCAEPIGRYLASFELRAGFVATARIAHGVTIPEPVRSHPAWATVEDLATTDGSVLWAAPLSSLKIARIGQRTFDELGTGDHVVTVSSLLLYPEPGEPSNRGLRVSPLDAVTWRALLDRGTIACHSLCLDASMVGDRVDELVASLLVQRLSHLDVWIDPARAQDWRRAFDRSGIPLLTLRFAVRGIEPVVAFELRSGGLRMIVELRATVPDSAVAELAASIAALGAGISELELVDTSGSPSLQPQAELSRALASTFSRLVLRRARTLVMV